MIKIIFIIYAIRITELRTQFINLTRGMLGTEYLQVPVYNILEYTK